MFNRVWDTPDNGYAEKFKHSIEPFLNVQRTSAIDNYNRIVKIDGTDQVVGGTTSYSYGLNNRFYAKRKVGQMSQAQEIIASRSQSYYSDPTRIQFDPATRTTPLRTPSNFSPDRHQPAGDANAGGERDLRAEFDSRYHGCARSPRAEHNWHRSCRRRWAGPIVSSSAISPASTIATLDHYLNVLDQPADARPPIWRDLFVQLRRPALHPAAATVSGFYNAQCCGLAFEYQRYNFAALSPVRDHRFFLSFTLAGLGNFSPFSGGLSGTPR